MRFRARLSVSMDASPRKASFSNCPMRLRSRFLNNILILKKWDIKELKRQDCGCKCTTSILIKLYTGLLFSHLQLVQFPLVHEPRVSNRL